MTLSSEAISRQLNTRVIGRSVEYHPVASSTQALARAAAQNGAPEGAVFIADRQTAGRGRLGRTWQAPAGSSLLISILLRPSPEVYPLLSMAAALAVCHAIEAVTGLKPNLKWPNDVLLSNRKVAGLLVEGELVGGDPDFAVMGVGVNVNLDPRDLAGISYPATSLQTETGTRVSRVLLARELILQLDRVYANVCSGISPRDEWKSALITLGRRVRVDAGTAVHEGVAEDVDEHGALLLRRDDGCLLILLAGEVTLQVPASG